MEQILPDEVLPNEVPLTILSKQFWSVLTTVLTDQYVNQVGAVRCCGYLTFYSTAITTTPTTTNTTTTTTTTTNAYYSHSTTIITTTTSSPFF